MTKLTLIDGSGYIFRAFHALPPMRRPDGVAVGAVYGFCAMLFKTLMENHTDSLVVVFDAGRQTFRQEIYPDYKAHRPDPPEDLIPQFQLIREACAAFNVASIEAVGFEADDLIATYAHHAHGEGYEVCIISSDKDLMQLVRPGVSMLDPIKNRPIGDAEVFEKFGVPPSKVVEVQALAGDSSDNVPGVPGIGIKTAAELINAYGDLETLLARAHEIKQPKRREALIENAEKARISRQLVYLRKDSPLPLALTDLKVRSLEQGVLNTFLRTQGFNSLIARIDRQYTAAPAPTGAQELPGFSITPALQLQTGYETVTTIEALNTWIAKAMASSIIAIDCETTSLNAVEAKLVGLSLATDKDQACYIPVAHQTEIPQLSIDLVLAALQPLLNNKNVLKVGHNLKYDLVVLGNYGVTISPLTDTMLMSYVLDAGKNGHGMDELAELHLGYKTIKFADVAGTGKAMKTFDYVPLDQATAYAAEDADITLQLYHVFYPRLIAEKMVHVFERLERPLVPVIAAMEQQGIRVDRLLLDRLGYEFSQQMTQLEKTIYKLAGREFNVGSPKQLGEVLFDEMGISISSDTNSTQKIKSPKKTKTGAYVTDVDVLESLAAQGHDLPARVLEWRGLSKLKSTYVDNLIAAVSPKTSRVHTSYSLAGTSTGRLSSSDPNLQNIPIRTENGRKIRQAFVADPGFRLVSLDYSQIELRLLAHMADVPALAEAFRKGMDIHTSTASTMFGIPPEQIDGTLRRKAKAINFGIIYGISAFGLANQLGIAQGEAAAYIKKYFETYPGIQDYMERCKEFARRHGYVQTLWGRKCYTLGIRDNNPVARQFAERQAINAPLQGSNADIIKRAMVHIPVLLQNLNSKTHMLLQVHDELIFEVPEAEINTTVAALKKLMENILILKVPLVVGVGIGNNWDEAH
ncbi:MAG: DNA polymerase I [Candidatus Paracaedibacter sp.]